MKFLPPGFETLSSNIFGSFFLQITNLRVNKNDAIRHFKLNFFGDSSDENTANPNIPKYKNSELKQIGQLQQYKIATHQWLFYSYLSDMQNVQIQLYSANNNAPPYHCRLPINLKNVRHVMTPDFKETNIFCNDGQQKCTVVDSVGNVLGSVGIRVWTQFDREIHQQIKELVDFNSMAVFEGISPINSQTQLPRQPPQLSFVASSHHDIQKLSKVPFITEQKNNPHYFDVNSQSHHQQCEDDQHRLIEQDIDKLIQQMQSKPYDCNRYQQYQEKNYSGLQSRFTQQNKPFYSSHQTLNKYKNSYHSSQNSHKFQQTQASIKPQTLQTLQRPPSQSHTHYKNRQQWPTNDKRQIISSGLHNSNAMKIVKGQNTESKAIQQNSTSQGSYIEMKIHEMQFSFASSVSHNKINELIQSCYTLKLYRNNELDEYFIGQGVKQGEIIKLNHILKIRNVKQLQNLKFLICDDYGRAQCEGIFQLSRLINSSSQKGVFIISMLPLSQTSLQSQIKIQQKKLTEVFPITRTLRIQAELIQPVELVQIFIKINKISIPFNKLRYKIPLTKQTIEQRAKTHINLFPHSLSNQCVDKVILQFWNNEENIGQCQVSLKNIKCTNINSINSSFDPIYLYDGKKQIRNILQGDRIVGDFNLLLCFGTVKQVQSLLLATIEQQKIMMAQERQKVPVRFDQRLGVIVNTIPKTKSNQISVQVQLEQEEHNPHFLQQSMHLLAKCQQPSFGQQSIISHTSNNQFLQASLLSFAKPSPAFHHQVFQNQQVIKVQHKLEKRFSKNLPTVTQKIGETLQQLLMPIVSNINKIKQQCKPHLLYNFIAINILKSILASLGYKSQQMDKLFKLVLFAKQDMINVNILYDLCASIQFQECIKPHLIGDQMLIVGALRLLYKNQKLRKNILLQNDLDFKQMVAVFQKIQLKLTLHEFQTLQKFLKNYPNKNAAQQLKNAIINQLQNEAVQQVKQGFYEQDILKQIYGQDSSFNYSNLSETHNEEIFNQRQQQLIKKQVEKYTYNSSFTEKQRQTKQKLQKNTQNFQKSPKQKKSTSKYTIMINGIQNVKDSAQCVFDQLPSKTYFRIIIDSPIFQELLFELNENSKDFMASNDLKDIDGRAQFVGNNKVLACSAFSLIQGVQSLYPMKTKDGHFCGLLKILVQ